MSYYYQTGAKKNGNSFQLTWLTWRKPPCGLRCLWNGPCWAESCGTWSHLNNYNKNVGQSWPAHNVPLSVFLVHDSLLYFSGHTAIHAPPQNGDGSALSQKWKKTSVWKFLHQWKKNPSCLFSLAIYSQLSIWFQVRRILKFTFNTMSISIYIYIYLIYLMLC